MRTHFPAIALAAALLTGSMTFAHAASAMSAPSAGAGTAAPSVGAATAAPTAGSVTAAPTVGHRGQTALPDPQRGMPPCRTGQSAGCDRE